VARFEPENADEAVAGVLRSLAYLGDIEDDPALAVSIEELEDYWKGRIPHIAGHLSRFAYDRPDSTAGAESDALAIAQLEAFDQVASSGAIGPHRPLNGKCKARTEKRRRCPFDALPSLAICGVHTRAGRR